MPIKELKQDEVLDVSIRELNPDEQLDIDSITWPDVGISAIKNIPQSGLNYAGNIYEVIKHPIDTAETLDQLVLGLAEKIIPGEQKDEKTIDVLGNFLKERYGGIDNIKKTIATDPIGFISDVSTVLMGTGAAISTTGKIAKLSKITRIGQTISKVGKTIEPLSIVKASTKQTFKLMPQDIINKLYASSVKMSTTLPATERTTRIITGLNEEILPTEKGLHKLWGRINETNKAISDNIIDAAKKGETINADAVVSKLDDLRSFYNNTINPKPFLDEIDDMEKIFKDAHGTKIPIDKAQKIKQNTYILLKKHYGELKGLNIEAHKTLARGIKDEIAKLHPEINSLNKTDSALISLEESIERSVARIKNRDLIGLGIKTGTGAGGVVDIMSGTKGPGLLTGLTTSLLDTPVIKAKLSIILHKAINKKLMQKYPIQRQILYQAGRIHELEE